MKQAFFLLAILGVFAVGCKKDDNPTTVVQTKSQLIARTWQMQTANVTVTSSGLTLPVYTKGGTSNILDFSTYKLALTSDGKFTLTSGTTTQTGTWQLLNNDAQLVLTYSDNTTQTNTVSTASATNLDLSYPISPTTTNATEKGYLAQAQALGQDVSKGLVIGIKLIPQ